MRVLEGGEGTSRNDAHACVLRKVAKKKKKLRKSSARSSVSHGHFALHVELVGNWGDDPDGLDSCGSYDVDARHAVDLLVPDNLTLRALHTDALAPALGWKRRYHGYFFTQASDGSQYGIAGDHPAFLGNGGQGAGRSPRLGTASRAVPMTRARRRRAGPIDLMHQYQRGRGYEFIDDRTVRVSQARWVRA